MIRTASISERADWLKAARAAFRPGERQPCEVCGKYKSLAQAHHVVPLAQQYGADSLNHEHVWLCPTHHSAIHILISQSTARRLKAGRSQIEMLNELEHAELSRLLEIFERFRNPAVAA